MESGRRKLANNPRESANWISVLFFGWSIPIFKKSYTDVLHPNDAFEPLDVDRSEMLGNRLERCLSLLMIGLLLDYYYHVMNKNEMISIECKKIDFFVESEVFENTKLVQFQGMEN